MWCYASLNCVLTVHKFVVQDLPKIERKTLCPLCKIMTWPVGIKRLRKYTHSLFKCVSLWQTLEAIVFTDRLKHFQWTCDCGWRWVRTLTGPCWRCCPSSRCGRWPCPFGCPWRWRWPRSGTGRTWSGRSRSRSRRLKNIIYHKVYDGHSSISIHKYPRLNANTACL